MSVLLKITDLFGGYSEGVDILCGISMEVQKGEAVGIIGLNGSGKSTFGKAIMNMIPFRKSEILFEGENITALSTCQLAHRGISFMQQGGKVFPNLSVWDNIQFATKAINCQGPMVNGQLEESIPLLKRSRKELQHLMADKLSGGQKHQLSIAMTLASNPRLVILDEPSAGLSPKAIEEMYQMLLDIKEKLNITIILIEQNIAKAVQFCNWCAIMKQGKVVQKYISSKIEFNEIGSLMF